MRISDWSSAVCSSALGGNGDLEPCRRAAPPPRAAHRPKHRIVACLRRIEPRHELRRDRERSRVACPEIEPDNAQAAVEPRSDEHTSELQSLMRISYALF